MSLKVHVQTHALAFARCLCIRVRKCVLHRIVGRRGRRSWGVEYTVKKEQIKKEGREREKEKAKMREIGREVSGRSRC